MTDPSERPAHPPRGSPRTAPSGHPLSRALADEIKAEFPAFRIVAKRSDRLSNAIDVLLRLVTLGQQSSYLTHYHTVLGFRLYVPPTWSGLDDVARTILLRHERVHLRQRRRYGMLGMAVLYLLPLFPIGLAWGRARLEWEAYTETLRATAELQGLEAARAPTLRAHILQRFTGPDYGWMWPFPAQLNRWYDAALASIERELSTSAPSHHHLGGAG